MIRAEAIHLLRATFLPIDFDFKIDGSTSNSQQSGVQQQATRVYFLNFLSIGR